MHASRDVFVIFSLLANPVAITAKRESPAPATSKGLAHKAGYA